MHPRAAVPALLICIPFAACGDDSTGPRDLERGTFTATVSGDRAAAFSGTAGFDTIADVWHLTLQDFERSASVSIGMLGTTPSPGLVSIDSVRADGTGGGVVNWDAAAYLAYSGELRILSANDSTAVGTFDILFAGFDPGSAAGDTVRVRASYQAKRTGAFATRPR